MTALLPLHLCVCTLLIFLGSVSWGQSQPEAEHLPLNNKCNVIQKPIDLSSYLSRSEPVTWLFIGDSITQGVTHTHGYRDFSQLFKERLCELDRKRDIVINTAVSGSSLRKFTPTLEYRALRFKPDVVFILFGTNDSVKGTEGLAEFTKLYHEMISRLKSAGAGLIVIQTTIPVMPLDPVRCEDEGMPLGNTLARLKYVPAYVEATRKVAKEMKCPLIDHYKPWMKLTSGRGVLTEGEIHPNGYGHRFMAGTIFRACGIWDEKSSWTCRLFVPISLEKSNQQ